MTKLSPQAQAVLETFRADWEDEHIKQDVKCLAAALRAAADEVVIKLGGLGQESAWYLEEIAAELEGSDLSGF